LEDGNDVWLRVSTALDNESDVEMGGEGDNGGESDDDDDNN
jgi:hypothetical protein